MDALAEKGRVDGESILRGPAPDEREVFLRDPATLHEHAEMPRGGVRFRDEHQAAGLAVEAIDDRDLAAVRELEGQQVRAADATSWPRPRACWDAPGGAAACRSTIQSADSATISSARRERKRVARKRRAGAQCRNKHDAGRKSKPMIRLDRVTRAYPGGVLALDDVSLEIARA